MLRSEASSNCEEDDSSTLLGQGMHLSLEDKSEGFAVTPEDVLQALTQKSSLFEDQAIVYIGGYIVKKVIEKFHSKSCEKCSTFGTHATSQPDTVPSGEFFIWLKKYDDNSKLYVPSPEFSDYIRKLCLLAVHCFYKHLSSPKVLQSATHAALKYIWAPEFCSTHVKEKTANLVMKTVLSYKLKWLNDSIRSTATQSQKKLQKIMHE